MAQREYIRLTRTHARSGIALFVSWRSSLWLARDHLLCIDTNGFMENYKRFYFRDIQAVSIRKTIRAAVWNILLSVLMGCFILAALMSDIPGLDVVFWVVAGMLFLVLALNLLGGPSCVCHLRTAVQNEELSALNRVRRARKILKRIRPLIGEAQGGIDPGEIPTLMHQLASGEPAAQFATSTAPEVKPV